MVFADNYWHLKRNVLPKEITNKFRTAGRRTVKFSMGRYKSSRRESNLIFRYRDKGFCSYTCAVEVGFDTAYEDLVDDIKMWLGGMDNMRTAILVKVDEQPPYKSPFDDMSAGEIKKLGFPAPWQLNNGMKAEPEVGHGGDVTDRDGTLQIKGLNWVNPMSAFVEVWTLNLVTSVAERKGNRTVRAIIP